MMPDLCYHFHMLHAKPYRNNFAIFRPIPTKAPLYYAISFFAKILGKPFYVKPVSPSNTKLRSCQHFPTPLLNVLMFDVVLDLDCAEFVYLTRKILLW